MERPAGVMAKTPARSVFGGGGHGEGGGGAGVVDGDVGGGDGDGGAGAEGDEDSGVGGFVGVPVRVTGVPPAVGPTWG